MTTRLSQHGSALMYVSLLLAVAITAILFVRTSLFPKETPELHEARQELATGTPQETPMTAIGDGRRDIDSAKAVQNQLNLHNMDINNSLGE